MPDFATKNIPDSVKNTPQIITQPVFDKKSGAFSNVLDAFITMGVITPTGMAIPDNIAPDNATPIRTTHNPKRIVAMPKQNENIFAVIDSAMFDSLGNILTLESLTSSKCSSVAL